MKPFCLGPQRSVVEPIAFGECDDRPARRGRMLRRRGRLELYWVRDGIKSSRGDFIDVEVAGPDFVRVRPTVDLNPTSLAQGTVGEPHAVTARATPRVETGAPAELQR